MGRAKPKLGDPTLARNRAATHEFSIIERFEAGIVLQGTEIKSLRAGHGQITQAYVRVEGGEAWLVGADIGEYDHGNRMNHDPNRRRKLLLHRREIEYLFVQTKKAGLTMVPLRIFLLRNHAKLEFGLARGKKQWDKRQSIAERDAKREADRAIAALRRRG